MAPPQKFTRAELQAAALDLVDERGLGALSMRNLAARLGTGAMTLYSYVRNRDELDALVVDAVMAEAVEAGDTAVDGGPAFDWKDDVRAVARTAFDTVHAHPHAIPLVLTCRIRQEGSLCFAERLLAALARSGRSDERLLIAFRLVSGFIIGLAQAQLESVTGPAHGPEGDPAVAQALALPPERFPHLIEIARATAQSSPRRQFEAGLETILAGLDTC